MTLSAERTAELRQAFSQNDLDGDGLIDFREFADMLESLEAGIELEQARIGFAELDTDDDGCIDFVEFIDWWSDR